MISGKVAVAGLAIEAVQFEMLGEVRHADKSLEGGFTHALGVGEAHVVIDQGENLLGVVVGETQTTEDFAGHFDANVNMSVEADAIGSDAKSRRLANIVQQRTPGECGRRAR